MKSKINLTFAFILGVFVLLALAYSIVNPIFESPDEYLHYDFVRYLIDRHELPVQMLGKLSEYHQPPLYYAIGALLIHFVQVDTYVPQDNPFFGYEAYRFGVDNKVRYIHTAQEAFPYQGTALAVHLLRVFSIVLAALSITVSFKALQEIFSRQVVVLSGVALIAFNPQFIFVSSSISNDNLIVLLGALMTWVSIRVARLGMTRRRAVIIATLAAAAVLTKLSAAVLILVPMCAAFLARISWRKWLSTLSTIAVALLVFAGWWFWRNLTLYGEPTGIRLWQQIWGWQTSTPNLSDLGNVLQNLWTSYWGRFGLGQIVLPNWLDNLLLAVLALSLFGLVLNLRQLLRRQVFELPRASPAVIDRRGLGILFSSFGLLFLASIWYSLVNPAGTAGRFLFPAMIAIGGLMAYGLHGLYRDSQTGIGRIYLMAICGLMLTFGLGSLMAVIAPAYAAPVATSLDVVRSQTRPVDIRFGDAAILLGYELDRDRVWPGDEMKVKLCWQAQTATPTPAYFFVHLLGDNDSIVAQRASLHGLGRYPSINWQPATIFCDDVLLQIKADTPVPKVYQLEVGMVDLPSRVRFIPIGPGNVELRPAIIGQVKVRSRAVLNTESIPNQADVEFDNQIALIGSAVNPGQIKSGGTVSVTLYWRPNKIPEGDYTVFVHFRDSTGRTVAQADSPPQAGAYPTSFWDAGEVVVDQHLISIPTHLASGDYSVAIGLYRRSDEMRLHITQGGSGDESALPSSVQVR